MNMVNAPTVAQVVRETDCPQWSVLEPDGTYATLAVVGRTLVYIDDTTEETVERPFPSVEDALVYTTNALREAIRAGAQLLAIRTPQRCFCGECPVSS
jgi:hypothetical protein